MGTERWLGLFLNLGTASHNGITFDRGRKVRLTFGEMKADRIYQLDLVGLISAAGRPLVHPTIAYTVNEVVK